MKDGSLILNLKQLKDPIEGKLASGAGIVSKRRFRYGYYEVKARLGLGQDTDEDGLKDEGWNHSFWAMAALVESSEVNSTYPDIRRTVIDNVLESIGYNHPEINRDTYHKLLGIYSVFGCIQPGENDEYRSTWMEAERGPIEVFGDYKEYKSEGEVKNKKEFRELWEMSYPSATKWYQFQHLLVIMHYIHYVCIT